MLGCNQALGQDRGPGRTGERARWRGDKCQYLPEGRRKGSLVCLVVCAFLLVHMECL